MAGIVLWGRFEVEKRIGRGGMAEVFLGKDLLLHGLAAVKVLRRVTQARAAVRGWAASRPTIWLWSGPTRDNPRCQALVRRSRTLRMQISATYGNTRLHLQGSAAAYISKA
jgi:serine/threonine protein kinase